MMNFRNIALAWVCTCLLAGFARADVLNVPAEFPTIQAAIDAAVDGDEVVVADGVYEGEGNVNVSFLGKAITVRSENGSDNCTIVGDFGGTNDNSRGFLFEDGEGPDSVLDGFVIRNFWAIPEGAGIFITGGASPTIKNCVITRCYGFDFGGAISVKGPHDGVGPLLIGCTIANNFADFGGAGVRVTNGASLTAIDCVFNGNFGPGLGGGIYASGSDTLTLRNCVVTGNATTGIQASGGINLKMVNCLVSGNTDGGVWANSAGGPGSGISNCTFLHNAASFPSGLYTGDSGNIGVSNSIFWDNLTLDGEPSDSINVAGNVVNYSIVQGGWTGDGEGTIDEDPLFATIASGEWTSPPSFDSQSARTMFLDENASFEPGALAGRLFNADLSQLQLFYIEDNTATAIIVRGDLFNGYGGVAGPTYASNGDESYEVYEVRPSAGSPAIDSADNGAVPLNIESDLDGNPRFRDEPTVADTGVGDCPVVDMGAYEFQSALVDCSNAIVSSAPPDGAIDARQPFDLDGTNVAGFDVVDLVFAGSVAGMSAADFELTVDGGDGAPPTIAGVFETGAESLQLDFDEPIEPGTWTTITHLESNSTVRIGYLPADVNNDGTSSSADVLALIDGLNGQGELAEYQSDIDRSGNANGADVLRVIDLLNGADAYDEWNLQSLPD